MNIKQLYSKNNIFTSVRILILVNLILVFAFKSVYGTVNLSETDSLKQSLHSSSGSEKAKTLLRLSGCYSNTDARQALDYAKQANKIAWDLKDNVMIGQCLIQKGLSYNNLSIYDSAIAVLNQSLVHYYEFLKPVDQGRLYTTLGIANENAGLSDSAFKCYHKAFEIYQLENNHQGVANSYLNLGCLFSRLKKYQESGKYLEKALSVSLSKNIRTSLGSIYNNLGVIYDVQGQKQKALGYYLNALEIQKEQQNKSGMANIYHNMSIIYNDLHDYPVALENLKKSLFLKMETGNREGMANSYSLMAAVYMNMGNIYESENYLLKALEIASDGHYLVVEAHGRKQLAEIYFKQGRYLESAEQGILAIKLNDSLYNQSVSKQLSDMQSLYEIKQKDQENQILKQQISLQQAHESQRRIFYRFITLAAIASTAVLVLLFILFRMKVLSMRKTKHLFDREYRLKELELAARENEYRILEIEKQREEAKKEYLLQKYQAEEEIRKLELYNLNTRIELKNKELTLLSANFISKNEILSQIRKVLLSLKRYFFKDSPERFNELISLVNSNLDTDLNWRKFRMSFEETYPGFLDRLSSSIPNLTLNEEKLCAYLYIGLSSSEISGIMNISIAAVNKNRQRFRKRIGLAPEGDIFTYLQNLYAENLMLSSG